MRVRNASGCAGARVRVRVRMRACARVRVCAYMRPPVHFFRPPLNIWGHLLFIRELKKVEARFGCFVNVFCLRVRESQKSVHITSSNAGLTPQSTSRESAISITSGQ
jgi:hypothetical protein